MRRWKLVVILVLSVLWMLACAEQASEPAVEKKSDSPMAGVWYLQAVAADRPIAGDVDVSFEFKAQGVAVYERTTTGPEEPEQFDLRYNLADRIISIDSNDDNPGVPRITGKIELSDDGQTLRIQTHSNERWVLTRDARPGGELEVARNVEQLESTADPLMVRVQRIAYAVGRYEQLFGDRPSELLDLVDKGLVSPEWLTESGQVSDLPARYPRMTVQERANWVAGNAAFALIDGEKQNDDRPTMVVTTLPRSNRAQVIVGMSNGSVYSKMAEHAAGQVALQGGTLPERWPNPSLSVDAAAGVEPLSD